MTGLQRCYWKYINALHKEIVGMAQRKSLHRGFRKITRHKVALRQYHINVLNQINNGKAGDSQGQKHVRKYRLAYLQHPDTAFVPRFLRQAPAAHTSLRIEGHSLRHCPLLQEPGLKTVGHDVPTHPCGSPSHASAPSPGDRCRTFPQESNLYHKMWKASVRYGETQQDRYIQKDI